MGTYERRRSQGEKNLSFINEDKGGGVLLIVIGNNNNTHQQHAWMDGEPLLDKQTVHW